MLRICMPWECRRGRGLWFDQADVLDYEVLVHVDRVLDYVPLPGSPSDRSYHSSTSGLPEDELEEEWPVRRRFIWQLGFLTPMMPIDGHRCTAVSWLLSGWMIVVGIVLRRHQVEEVLVCSTVSFRCHRQDHMTCLFCVAGMEAEVLATVEVEGGSATSAGSSNELGPHGDGELRSRRGTRSTTR